MLKHKWQNRVFWWIIISLLLLIPTEVLAAESATTVDAIQMLVNLSQVYPAFTALATAFCYLVAFVLAIRGVYYLKVYGELRTMMTTQSSLKVPITYFIAATVFIYIPSAYQTFLYTFFQSSSPLAYNDVVSSIDPRVLKAIVGLVQLVGLFAFIRGWMILVAIAQHSGGGQHTVGKALTHIIGGIFAINILGISQMLWATFGFNFHI